MTGHAESLFVTRSTEWPASQKSATPDPGEVAATKEAFPRSDNVRAFALMTFDFTQYPAVYVDDPEVPLSPERAAHMDKARQGLDPSASTMLHDGFLSFQLAQVLNDQRGVEALEQAQAKADAEHLLLSAADFKSIYGVVGVSRCRACVIPPRAGLTFAYKKVAVYTGGKRAEVTYNDGELGRGDLVKTSEGWKIAGIRPSTYLNPVSVR